EVGVWVGGVETDCEASGQWGGAGLPGQAGVCNTSAVVPAASRLVTGSISQKLAWFGTLRGRLGVTITPTVLAYGTVGVAYGEVYSERVLSGIGAAGPGSHAFSGDDRTTPKTGWAAGLWLQDRLVPHWTGPV